VYLPNEADAEPLATVLAMAEAAKAHGAVFMANTEVYEIQRSGAAVTGLRTTAGVLSAEEYVLATGSWSPQWAEVLRLNIPIQAGKGYALILDPIDPAPKVPMSLVETKVAVTPRDGSVRLAGTMELAGLNESITPRRVRAILAGARRYLNVPQEPRVIEVWRGLRPCTPDGLPMIGRARRWENLTIAAGHAMLGFTLGAGTGRLVCDLLNRDEPLVDPEPFDPERFN
jgi:D-amino-acid dehydrogenase